VDSDPETAATVTDSVLTGTAIYGVLVGSGFVIAGIRGRQMWMTWWGGGLALASVAYLVLDAMGVA
jgi:hypothetical protein